MKTLEFSHQRGRSPKGLVTEEYIPKNQVSDTPIVILTGFGTTPPSKGDRAELSDQELNRTSYLGWFPALTAQLIGYPVHVTYHPAVSGLITKAGLYNARAAVMQYEESPEGHLVAHSLATCICFDILKKDRLYAGITDTTKSITLAAPWTNARDSLTLNGKMRKLAGLSLETAFKALQHFPAPCYYPLFRAEAHSGDNETETSKHWGAAFIARATSAKYALKLDAEKKLADAKSDQTPLVIIPTQDKIFEPEGQRKIAKMLEAKTVEIEAGHRFFTADRELLKPVIESIHDHIKASENE